MDAQAGLDDSSPPEAPPEDRVPAVPGLPVRPSERGGAAVRAPARAETPSLLPAGGAATGAVPWRAAPVLAAALVGALGLLALAWLLARPLALLLAAVVVGEALAPAVRRLERWLPRGAAVGAVYAVLVALLALAAWRAVPPLVTQSRELVFAAPELVERGRRWADELDPAGAQGLVDALRDIVARLADALVALPLTLFASVLDIVLVLSMSAYWLVAAPALRRFALSLLPAQHRHRAERTLTAMGQTMGGYVRATLINAVIIGVLTYAGLLVLGVDYPLVLALMAAAGELVPVVGPIVAAVPAIAVALLDSPEKALATLVFFVVLQQTEANLLVPHIMRRQADVPPLLSIFALLAGSTLGGLLGALVAIPLAGALRVLTVEVLAPAERRWVGAEERGGPAAGEG